MPHRVSVITPSYNQGRFIERTIQSVLAQQFPGNLEYLVMDGGSNDGTLAILKRYDSSVHAVSEKDRGQADAVNKGLARATGDIIGWLNSDDIYYPGALAAACEALDSHPDVDVVYGDANHIDEHGGIIEPYPTEPWNSDRLLEACYLCQPAVFFRKRVVDRFGPLNEELNFCLDYEYWIRLAAAGAKFLRVRQVLAGSRLHAETKTRGFRIRFHTEINDMLCRYAARVPDSWLFSYAHAVLDEKGFPRSDKLRFPLLVSALSLRAALRWNRAISRQMTKTTGAWAMNAIRNFCRRKIVK
ncbi:MAG: glycosyltransferase [Acidobacteriia bacterium]|nr:glycosyltransferase [Terriglobia bacterium]